MLGKKGFLAPPTPPVQGPRTKDGRAPTIAVNRADKNMCDEIDAIYRLQVQDGYELASDHASDGGARRKGKIR